MCCYAVARHFELQFSYLFYPPPFENYYYYYFYCNILSVAQFIHIKAFIKTLARKKLIIYLSENCIIIRFFHSMLFLLSEKIYLLERHSCESMSQVCYFQIDKWLAVVSTQRCVLKLHTLFAALTLCPVMWLELHISSQWYYMIMINDKNDKEW